MAASHRARAAAGRLSGSLRLLAALSLLSCACALSCATTSLERREWWHVQTTRFDVRSSIGEAASLRLARDLESFAIAAEAVLGTPLTRPPVRTRVYAHDGKGFERPFDVGNRPSYFLPTLEGGVLVLRVGTGFRDASDEALFELARYLAHNNGGLETPLWYDEGFAAFLSTARISGRAIAIGESIMWTSKKPSKSRWRKVARSAPRSPLSRATAARKALIRRDAMA